MTTEGEPLEKAKRLPDIDHARTARGGTILPPQAHKLPTGPTVHTLPMDAPAEALEGEQSANPKGQPTKPTFAAKLLPQSVRSTVSAIAKPIKAVVGAAAKIPGVSHALAGANWAKQKVAERHGPKTARNIAVAANLISWGAFIAGPFVGMPNYIPATALMAAGAGLAEGYRALKGGPKTPQANKMPIPKLAGGGEAHGQAIVGEDGPEALVKAGTPPGQADAIVSKPTLLRPKEPTMVVPLSKPESQLAPDVARAQRTLKEGAAASRAGGDKPAPGAAPMSFDGAAKLVQNLYDSALGAGFTFDGVDKQLAALRSLKADQLKHLAQHFQIYHVPGRSKADYVSALARKIKGRREFHDRASMTPMAERQTASAPQWFHVTKNGVADVIRKEGFKAGAGDHLELGPVVYLSKDQERFPTHLAKKSTGETFETETVQAGVDPKAKLFPLNSEAPNPALEIYRRLFPKDYGQRYDQDARPAAQGGKIYTPNLKVNWPHLHGLLQEHGYGGIERTAREGDVGNTDAVVFNPKNVTPKMATGGTVLPAQANKMPDAAPQAGAMSTGQESASMATVQDAPPSGKAAPSPSATIRPAEIVDLGGQKVPFGSLSPAVQQAILGQLGSGQTAQAMPGREHGRDGSAKAQEATPAEMPLPGAVKRRDGTTQGLGDFLKQFPADQHQAVIQAAMQARARRLATSQAQAMPESSEADADDVAKPAPQGERAAQRYLQILKDKARALDKPGAPQSQAAKFAEMGALPETVAQIKTAEKDLEEKKKGGFWARTARLLGATDADIEANRQQTQAIKDWASYVNPFKRRGHGDKANPAAATNPQDSAKATTAGAESPSSTPRAERAAPLPGPPPLQTAHTSPGVGGVDFSDPAGLIGKGGGGLQGGNELATALKELTRAVRDLEKKMGNTADQADQDQRKESKSLWESDTPKKDGERNFLGNLIGGGVQRPSL